MSEDLNDPLDIAYQRRWVEKTAEIVARLGEWTDARVRDGGGATDREKELLSEIQLRLQQVKSILAQLGRAAGSRDS